MKTVHVVNYFEFERGWGSRHDGSSTFDTEEKALAEVKRFNSKNTEASAPDWYMVAEYGGIMVIECNTPSQ